MKFAHISDLHLGRKLDQGSPWEKKTANVLFDAFVNLIDIAEADKLDFLFITGDLFDHIPTVDEISKVDMQLMRLTNTYIIYVTGEADYLSKNSPLWTYKFRSNTFLMNGEEFNNCVPESRMPVRNSYAEGIADSLYFEKYNLDIYGICQYSEINKRNDLDYVYAHNTNRKNILLAHGGDKNVSPFALDDLSTKKFDYIGMGHSHNFRCKKEYNFYYPGALEPLGPEDVGEHGYIKGYMDNSINSVKFVPTSQRRYKTLEVEADDTMTNTALNSYLMSLCSKDKHCIYTIIIKRSKSCYLDFDISLVKEKYKILSVEGESADGADFKKLEKLNANNLLGKNLKRIRESKSPNANAAFAAYAHAMSKALWGDDEDLDIEDRVADMSQVVMANKQIVESKKQEIGVLKKHMNNLADQHSKLSNKLEKYPDQTGNLNKIREKIREIEYEANTISFKDQQVDKIYSRRRLGFVLLVDTPIALALAYMLTIGVIFAVVFRDVDGWISKTLVCVGLFAVFNLIGLVIYNKTKKQRNKWFGTPIPQEEHIKNKNMLKALDIKLDACLSKETEYKEKQKIYLQLSKEKEELQRKMNALEAKYKEAVLVSGEL
ncbi:MAG: metallophosphoesterase [Lachnospiraceae bacterium]|nr:metallophosphoesterase [Lachnospiraceae bacterium]